MKILKRIKNKIFRKNSFETKEELIKYLENL